MLIALLLLYEISPDILLVLSLMEICGCLAVTFWNIMRFLSNICQSSFVAESSAGELNAKLKRNVFCLLRLILLNLK